MNKGLTERNKQIENQLSIYTCKNVAGIIFNYYLNEEEEDYFYSMLRNKTIPNLKKVPLLKQKNGKFLLYKDLNSTNFKLSSNKWEDFMKSISNPNLVGLLIGNFTYSYELIEFGLINFVKKIKLKFLYMNFTKYCPNPVPTVMNFKKSMIPGSYFIFVYFASRPGRGIRRTRIRGYTEKRTLYVSKDLNGKFRYCILNWSNNIVQNSFGELCR